MQPEASCVWPGLRKKEAPARQGVVSRQGPVWARWKGVERRAQNGGCLPPPQPRGRDAAAAPVCL